MPSSKWIRALVALALVTSPAFARAAAPAPAKNLLLNPGFERGQSGHEWMPAAWDTSDAGLTTVFFGRDTLAAHGGHYSVNVANTSVPHGNEEITAVMACASPTLFMSPVTLSAPVSSRFSA